MEKYAITFHSTKQMKDFVSWAVKIPYNMDAAIGSVTVDAKSFLGLTGLGLEKEFHLVIYGELSDKDKSYIQQY